MDPERHEHTAVECAQMQGTQKQDAVHPPKNGSDNAGSPSWPGEQLPFSPAQWAVSGRTSESGKADASHRIMATESMALPQARAARTTEGMCKAWQHDQGMSLKKCESPPKPTANSGQPDCGGQQGQ